MNIQLKDENFLLDLTNEENNNDNYITCTVRGSGEVGRVYVSLDLDILELYSAVLSFITLKKKNEERDEHYARIK